MFAIGCHTGALVTSYCLVKVTVIWFIVLALAVVTGVVVAGGSISSFALPFGRNIPMQRLVETDQPTGSGISEIVRDDEAGDGDVAPQATTKSPKPGISGIKRNVTRLEGQSTTSSEDSSATSARTEEQVTYV